MKSLPRFIFYYFSIWNVWQDRIGFAQPGFGACSRLWRESRNSRFVTSTQSSYGLLTFFLEAAYFFSSPSDDPERCQRTEPFVSFTAWKVKERPSGSSSLMYVFYTSHLQCVKISNAGVVDHKSGRRQENNMSYKVSRKKRNQFLPGGI